LAVQGQRAGQGQRGAGVHTGHQRLAPELAGGGTRTPASGVVKGDGQVRLGLLGDGVGLVDRPVHYAGRKAGDGGPGEEPEVAIDDGRAGVRHGGAGEHGETRGRSEVDRRLTGRRCTRTRRQSDQRQDQRNG